MVYDKKQYTVFAASYDTTFVKKCALVDNTHSATYIELVC